MRIGVLGRGAVCTAGLDVAAIERAVGDGTAGPRPVQRFDASMFTGPWAGEVDLEALRRRAPASLVDADPCTLLAADAARQAWSSCAVDAPPHRVALVLGTSAGNHNSEDLSEELERTDPAGAFARKEAARHWTTADAVARLLGIEGPRLTVSSACASGNLGLSLARELLLTGVADVVLAGGADAISPRRFAGFDALGVVGTAPGAPFSHPTGMNVGEGAAFVVLAANPAQAQGWLLGSGGSCDAHHATAPDPKGSGIARAMRSALDDAGLPTDAIGLLSAHATGTEANDAAEWRAVESTLGSRPWIAAKGWFGHSFGAAGALESVLTLGCLQTGRVPAPPRWTRPRRLGPQEPGGPAALERFTALGVNAAFGGANAALVWARESGRECSREPRRVRLVGTGNLLGDAGAEPEASTTRAALRRVARGVDPRSLDEPAAWLCVAVGRALADAGITPRGAARDRIGIVGAATRRSVRVGDAIRASVDSRGLTGLSALAFSRTVLNAPQGAAARGFGLRGPTTTLATGPGCGLLAVVVAAQALRWRRDADQLVVAAVDELDPCSATLDPGDPTRPRDASSLDARGGGAAVVLSVLGEGPEILGTGLAGPGRLDDAIRAAVGDHLVSEAAGVSGTRSADAALRDAVRAVLPTTPWRDHPGDTMDSVEGLLALVPGTGALLLVTEHPGTGCAALLLGPA